MIVEVKRSDKVNYPLKRDGSTIYLPVSSLHLSAFENSGLGAPKH